MNCIVINRKYIVKKFKSNSFVFHKDDFGHIPSRSAELIGY